MFEWLAFILAMAVQSTSQGGTVQTASEGQTDAAPAFLTPQAGEETAAPAFLQPAAKPALVAEPQVPTGQFTTATEVKPILNVTKGNWVAVREFNGQDLLYVTHLWSWRCGLLEMRVGINGAEPEPWPMPACHTNQAAPNAVLPDDGLPYRTYALGSIQDVRVELVYDDLSEDAESFARAKVQMP